MPCTYKFNSPEGELQNKIQVIKYKICSMKKAWNFEHLWNKKIKYKEINSCSLAGRDFFSSPSMVF